MTFMRYRSRMDIASDMLHMAQEGTIKTKIFYRALLSYHQLKEYVGLMIGGVLRTTRKTGANTILHRTTGVLRCIEKLEG